MIFMLWRVYGNIFLGGQIFFDDSLMQTEYKKTNTLNCYTQG